MGFIFKYSIKGAYACVFDMHVCRCGVMSSRCVSKWLKAISMVLLPTLDLLFLFEPLPFCVLSSELSVSLLSLLRHAPLCILRCHVIQCGSTRRGSNTKHNKSRERFRGSRICLSFHSSSHVALCMHNRVCVFFSSPRTCVSLSLRLCFPCMFYVFHFQAVINSPTLHRPRCFALLVFASLCSHLVWNLHSLIIPAHLLGIAHSLPRSARLSLPLWSVRPLQLYSARRWGH